MISNYIALLIFAAFAIFVPLSFLLTAKLLGRKRSGNPVKNAPYESGEEPIGVSKDVENEYLPNFMLFLPFEIIIVLLLVWAAVNRAVPLGASIWILALAVCASALSIIGFRMPHRD